MCRPPRRADRLRFVLLESGDSVETGQTRLYGLWGYTFLFRKRGSEKAVHHPTFAHFAAANITGGHRENPTKLIRLITSYFFLLLPI